MDTEKILSKITPKDYHNELEIILEDKDFSEDVKNLLLSCIYKIEAGYRDYEIVKKEVVSKKEYLEEILSIIKKKCHHIEIRKEETKTTEDDSKTRYEIDRVEGSIVLWHPNEKALLYAIYELDDNQIYVDEKYSLIRTSLSELLNKGENMNRLEVLRDFNGWNWNTDPDELQNITINLVYQNLITLLGINFMEEWIHSEEVKDYFGLAKEKIKEKFGKEKEEIISKLISKLALNTCIRTNVKQKEYLLEEKEELEKELAKLNNKRELLEEISENKKEALTKIKELDTILNDKKLLEQEYIKRNEKLPEYHKIFSLSHLTEILTKQRKKIMQKMEEQNKMLEPSYYVEIKTKLEEKLNLLSGLDLTKEQLKEKILADSIALEKTIMDCFKTKINEIDQIEKTAKKEELIKRIYEFRYYCFLYFENGECIGKVKKLQDNIINIQKILIQKAKELKCINQIAKEEKDFEILRMLFDTRMINLENMVAKLQKKETIEVCLYETDILEKTILLPIEKEDLTVKLDKKIKLMI